MIIMVISKDKLMMTEPEAPTTGSALQRDDFPTQCIGSHRMWFSSIYNLKCGKIWPWQNDANTVLAGIRFLRHMEEL